MSLVRHQRYSGLWWDHRPHTPPRAGVELYRQLVMLHDILVGDAAVASFSFFLFSFLQATSHTCMSICVSMCVLCFTTDFEKLRVRTCEDLTCLGCVDFCVGKDQFHRLTFLWVWDLLTMCLNDSINGLKKLKHIVIDQNMLSWINSCKPGDTNTL